MSKPEFPTSTEAQIQTRIESAETASGLVRMVDEIISTDEYMMTGKGGDTISAINRAGIKKFGRDTYRSAFDSRLGDGMADMYIKSRDEDPA